METSVPSPILSSAGSKGGDSRPHSGPSDAAVLLLVCLAAVEKRAAATLAPGLWPGLWPGLRPAAFEVLPSNSTVMETAGSSVEHVFSRRTTAAGARTQQAFLPEHAFLACDGLNFFFSINTEIPKS